MKTKVLTILALLSLSLLVKAQNDSNSTEISLEGFSGISVKGTNLLLNMVQEDANSLEVFGDNINKVKYEINDGILKLDVKTLNEKAYIRLGFENINSIKISDVVKINCEQLNADSLLIQIDGAAKMELKNIETRVLYTNIEAAAELVISGKSDFHKLSISGAGDVNASDLVTKETNVNISGAGKAQVNTTEKITGDISGAAKLEFLGDPQVNDIKVSGVAVFKGKSSKNEQDTVSVRIGNYNLDIFEDDEKNKKKKKHYDDFTPWSGFELGVAALMNPDYSFVVPVGYEFSTLDYKKSMRVGINFAEKNFPIVKHYLMIGSGFGLEINNYRFLKNTRLNSNVASFSGYIDTVYQFDKSKLRLSYLNIPLLIEFNSSGNAEKALHLAAGLVVGYNVGSKTKVVYLLNGNKIKEKAKGDFNVNPFRYALTARAGFGENIMVYATYDLSELFLKNQGPEFNAFSVGLSFVDF